MAHALLFGLLGAFVVSRVMRRRWRHAYAHGGCARFRGVPIDLGAPDVERRFGWRSRRRWRADMRAAAAPVDLAGSLELNQRQREIFDDVVAKAKTKLGAPELAEALAIVGREPFEREAVESLVGKGELADDLEQLHFSLTPEQRGKLRTVASA